MSEDLLKILSRVKKVLPSQGPLEFFVHHNTLHALEHESFKQALEKGQVIYEAQMYLSVSEYKKKYEDGEIFEEYLERRIASYFSNIDIEESFLKRLVKELIFLPSSSQLVFTEVPEALELGPSRSKKVFFSDVLKNERNFDIDDVIRHKIFGFFSAYFDQGYAYWSMPDRNKGLLHCFKQFISLGLLAQERWILDLKVLENEISSLSTAEKIEKLLSFLKVPKGDCEEYLYSLANRYKGWVSLNNSLEDNPDWNRNPEWVKPSFQEMVAILLLSEVSVLKTLDFEELTEKIGGVTHLRYVSEYSEEFLSRVAYLSQTQGMDTDALRVVAQNLRDIDREHILHCAWEDSFYDKYLKAFLGRQGSAEEVQNKKRPSFQIFCCIDDREESFRRYIEELDPRCETLGVAGHFGLDIDYKGAFSAYNRSLCPDIIKPTKSVREEVVENHSLRNLITTWAELSWLQSTGSRMLFRGWFFQFFMSFFAFVPLALSILAPAFSAKIKRRLTEDLSRKIKTKLVYLKKDLPLGMSAEDEIRYAESLLKTMGLTKSFAPVVFATGHGSHSLNNPHESAYNCGACGGGRGAPNGRLIAHILNKETVREALFNKGIKIPQDTVFVGGYHNTASDEVSFFDVPEREDVKKFIKTIQKAGAYNAKERCRRFEEIPLGVTPSKAFDHVKGRAHDYCQARPEYNHAANALCIVGPREHTKNLFLDHRAFLVSYDHDQDHEGNVLKNIMSAVGPVCSGINLEYFFSCVDSNSLGCGSKLPHNVTGLLGVMSGFESDLLLGLSDQMIEIHEPFRLMLTIVSPLERVKNLFDQLESFNRLVRNEWIRLSVYDPKTKDLYVYSSEGFQLADIVSLSSPVYEDNFSAFSKQRGVCEFGNIGVSRA